jgi:hypothetical protein
MSKREGDLVHPAPWRETVYVCDRCKVEAPRGVWSNDPHGDTTIECKSGGEVYNDYDERTTYRVDLCPPCFTTWLVPLLALQGVKAREE